MFRCYTWAFGVLTFACVERPNVRLVCGSFVSSLDHYGIDVLSIFGNPVRYGSKVAFGPEPPWTLLLWEDERRVVGIVWKRKIGVFTRKKSLGIPWIPYCGFELYSWNSSRKINSWSKKSTTRSNVFKFKSLSTSTRTGSTLVGTWLLCHDPCDENVAKCSGIETKFSKSATVMTWSYFFPAEARFPNDLEFLKPKSDVRFFQLPKMENTLDRFEGGDTGDSRRCSDLLSLVILYHWGVGLEVLALPGQDFCLCPGGERASLLIHSGDNCWLEGEETSTLEHRSWWRPTRPWLAQSITCIGHAPIDIHVQSVGLLSCAALLNKDPKCKGVDSTILEVYSLAELSG